MTFPKHSSFHPESSDRTREIAKEATIRRALTPRDPHHPTKQASGLDQANYFVHEAIAALESGDTNTGLSLVRQVQEEIHNVLR